VSDQAAPRTGGTFGAALVGGLVGAVATLLVILFVVPQYLSGRIVRQGMMADPQILADTAERLRDSQYAPVIAANKAALETPFGSSWKGSAKPDVTVVEFFDYACPYCKASNPAVERLVQEDKGLRIVYRELPILGPNSVTAARLSLEASRAGHFAAFHDTLWATGRLAPETIAVAAKAAGVAPEPNTDPALEAELKRNFQLAGQLGATGTPLFVIGDRVLNGAVGYDALKQAIEAARKKAS
jgi:protein-disulfide isomerase